MDIEYLECEVIELPELDQSITSGEARDAGAIYLDGSTEWRDRCYCQGVFGS